MTAKLILDKRGEESVTHLDLVGLGHCSTYQPDTLAQPGAISAKEYQVVWRHSQQDSFDSHSRRERAESTPAVPGESSPSTSITCANNR